MKLMNLCILLLVNIIWIAEAKLTRARKKCPPLPFIDHGTYTILRNNNNKVRINCQEPYIYISPTDPLSDSSVILCKNGAWSDPSPRCQLPSFNCDPPPQIANGRYTGFPPFEGGYVIKYSCNSGYILQGPATRTCQDRIFTWTDYDPVCEKYDPSIQGVANRIGDEIDKIEMETGEGRAIEADVEHKGLDLMLVFDKSSSIQPTDFKKGIEFAQYLISRFNISNDDKTKVGGTRISILTFGDQHAEVVTFNDKTVSSTEIAQHRLENIKCGDICDGSTNMAAALQRLQYVVQTMTREDAKKALFVTSDGAPDDPKTAHELASKLQDLDVEIFAIGIGQDIDKEFLRSVVTQPPVEHLFLLDTFSDFDDVVGIIRDKAPPTPAPTSNMCGTLSRAGKNRNVNPGFISPSWWPWLATIVISHKSTTEFACTGALICSQWVLLPTSCLIKDEKPVSAEQVFVILGEENLVKESEDKEEQTFYVKEIHINDDYKEVEYVRDDVAVIKLDREVKYTDYVRTVCIPEVESFSTRPDTQLTLVGYLTASEDSDRIKKYPLKINSPSQTNVSVLSIDDCQARAVRPIECEEGNGAATVGEVTDKDCPGGAKGALLMASQNGRGQLIGLVSKANGCNLQNQLVFFTQLNLQLDWIKISSDSCIDAHI